MKRALSIILILTLAFSLCACGSSSNDSVSMYDLQVAMLEAAPSLPDMSTVNSSADDAAELLTYVSDIDYDKVDGYFLAYSSEGLADEIFVMRLKSANDVPEAKETIETHVQSRISLFKSYSVDQVPRAEDAKIYTEGKYVILIICDEASQVKTAFDNAVK